MLDLDGNIVLITSKKNLSRSKIIRLVSKFVTPVIIASDTSPPSRIIEKIAACFSARLMFPRQTITRQEKTKLVKYYKLENYVLHNRHEKDALAAALYAWNKIKSLIKRINKKTQKQKNKNLNIYVKINVLLKGKSIDSSIKQFLKEKDI
jgi:hypothetical protein